MDIIIELILELLVYTIDVSYDKKKRSNHKRKSLYDKIEITSPDLKDRKHVDKSIFEKEDKVVVKKQTKKEIKAHELKQRENKYYLLVAILLHVFYEDDQRFNTKEKLRIKRHIQLSSIVTSSKTRKELNKMLKQKVTRQQLINIVSNYNLTEEDVSDAMNLIYDRMSKGDKDFKYTGLLRNIHSKLISEF